MASLKQLATLLRPHGRKVLISIVASQVAVSGVLIMPSILKNQVRVALNGDFDSDAILVLIGLGAGLLFIAAAGYAAFYVMFNVANDVISDLRFRYVNRLLAAPMEFHRDHPTGEIIDRLLTSLAEIERFIKTGLLNLTGAPLFFGGGIALMIGLSWQLALTIVAVVPLVTLALRAFLERVRSTIKEVNTVSEGVTAHIQGLLLGIDIIKAFAMESHERSRFSRLQNKMLIAKRREGHFLAMIEPLLATAAVGTIILIFIYGSWLLSRGEIQIEELMAFIFYASILVPQSRTISLAYISWQQLGSAFRRLDSILTLPGETDLPDARPLPTPLSGAIKLNDVSYGYASRERVLDRISFSVAARECVGIVGASGSGKTTLFNLLLRLYHSEQGTITIDGIDIRHTTADSLRASIAVVPQDTILFDGTIIDNVRYGRITATEKEVHAACIAAQADEYIRELPGGYNTVVGERGLKLSGGQRQRIAIARALLKNAPILLLDEATSALDAHTEQDLQKAMLTVQQGRTTIIIAHRLATVVDLPRIIVMHGGRVIDEGSHRDLLQRSDHYRTLVAHQLVPMDMNDEPVTV